MPRPVFGHSIEDDLKGLVPHDENSLVHISAGTKMATDLWTQLLRHKAPERLEPIGSVSHCIRATTTHLPIP